MCLYGIEMQNPRFKANKINRGVVPKARDNRIKGVPVPCGVCIECRKKKAREWQVRLTEEIRDRKDGQFVTFTFSDKWLKKLEAMAKEKKPHLSGYDLENAAAKLAVKRFLGRWKNHNRVKRGVSVRHWFTSELGGTRTERIHLHGILFTEETKEHIEMVWKYGKVDVGEYVNNKTVNYIMKYVQKVDAKHKYYKSLVLTSPGMGKGYLDRADARKHKWNGNKTDELYITREGIKLPLPRYYRQKLWTDEQREKLWLYKIIENKKYVMGVEVDLNKDGGKNIYKKLRAEARIKNSKLGYGDWINDKTEKLAEIKLRLKLKWYRDRGAVMPESQKEEFRVPKKEKYYIGKQKELKDMSTLEWDENESVESFVQKIGYKKNHSMIKKEWFLWRDIWNDEVDRRKTWEQMTKQIEIL